MAALRRTVTAAEEARLADGSVETWTTSAERSEVEAILRDRGKDDPVAARARLAALDASPVMAYMGRGRGLARDVMLALWGIAARRRRAAIAAWAARAGVPAHLALRRFGLDGTIPRSAITPSGRVGPDPRGQRGG